MEISEDGRPILRFSLFKAWWSNKQLGMEKFFREEQPKLSTKWVDFGGKVADALNKKEEWVKHLDIPEFDKSEYRVIEEFEEIPQVLIRGTLDRYSTSLHSIIDDKCCKNKSSAIANQYKEQLLFYQVLIEKKYGYVSDTSYIHWIPVGEDENGIVRFTGDKPVLLPHITTQAMRDELKEKIISTAKDINICWEAFRRGDIKL